MKLGKTLIACLFLAAVPAYCQRGTIGIDLGQISDKFGAAARSTALVGDLNGQFVVLQGKQKEGSPDIVAGGEMRFPSDTQNHASEFALYGGVHFPFGQHFSAGFHVQVRKILMPPSTANGSTISRSNLKLLELPVVLEYKFSTAPRHAFLQVQGQPEFTPHFATSANGPSPFPNPQFDHGYTLQGSVGYVFTRWYARASYESRYFKFTQTLGNPNGFYNWRTDAITGGVGFVF